MKANEQRVLSLIDKLPDYKQLVENNAECVVDEQWDAHHCGDIIVSCTIDDYQVFRSYNVEIDQKPLWDMANERFQDMKKNGEVNPDVCEDSYIEEIEQDIIDEEGFYDFEIGEYLQLWHNVKTKENVYVGKIDEEDAYYCDFNNEWTIIDPASTDKNIQKFASHFCNRFFRNDGHYIDKSVHPMFQAWGYTGINALNWCYGCGEDCNRSHEANFYLKNQGSWIDFLYSFEHGNEYDTMFKAYGSHAYFRSLGMTDKRKKEYLAATKIVRRNKYHIADQQMWDDMVDALYWLGRDLHNASYVCPSDLHEAHDRWTKLYGRKKAEIERQKRMEEAAQKEAAYHEMVCKVLDIKTSTKDFDIFVCPTVADMADEGEAMHHCVYMCGYYEAKKKCFILLVRDKQGNRIATSRLQYDTWKIAETRGLCNHVPTLNDEPCVDKINRLIRNMIPRFKQALNDNIIPINNTIITTTAEQAPLALAA